MYNGNAWHIVAGGQLTSENLRFMGTYNADTNTITTLTDEGTAEQLDGSPAFSVGSAVPACQDELSGCYFLIETGGDNISLNDVNGNTFGAGDLLLGISTATGWVKSRRVQVAAVAAAVSGPSRRITYRRADPNQRSRQPRPPRR